MAKDITLKSPDGNVTYYPKTVSDLVYDNETGKTLSAEFTNLKTKINYDSDNALVLKTPLKTSDNREIITSFEYLGTKFMIFGDTNGQGPQITMTGKSSFYNYNNGMFGISLVTDQQESTQQKAPIGLTRYFWRNNTDKDVPFDIVNGVNGSSQYTMNNMQGNTVMEIDKDGNLQINGYVKQSQLPTTLSEFAGKKIVMIGDSVMTGYPNNQGDGDTNDAKTYAYPYILGNMLGAEVKVIALPNAVARTSNIDGVVPDARKDRIFMNTIEQATSLNNGDTTKVQTATKFSYQSEFTNVLQGADLIIWGLGVNDVDEDVSGEDTNRSLRTDSEFVENTSVPIDTLDTKYYTGAFNTFMNYVYSNKITAKVAILTHYTYSDAQFYPLNLNERLIARQKELAKHWSIPCLCPADLLGWGYNGDRAKSPLIHYCPDELHPTVPEGKTQICKAIKKEMENKVVIL